MNGPIAEVRAIADLLEHSHHALVTATNLREAADEIEQAVNEATDVIVTIGRLADAVLSPHDRVVVHADGTRVVIHYPTDDAAHAQRHAGEALAAVVRLGFYLEGADQILDPAGVRKAHDLLFNLKPPER